MSDGYIRQEIYCCGCEKEVEAILTSGQWVCPDREESRDLPFWMCSKCENFVGCDQKAKDTTKPLGNIPTEEINGARKHINKIFYPLWRYHPEKFKARAWINRWLSHKLGYEYHTAEIKTIEEAREVYSLVKSIKKVEDIRIEKDA